MQAELTIEILPSELVQVVEAVFATMLSLEVVESGTAWFPSDDRLTAWINLTGQWNGEVVLECDGMQACRLAGRFLSSEPLDGVDEVVRDVLAELVNMVGGNLKCVLSRGILLSEPSVADGSGYRLPASEAHVRQRAAFQSSEGTFWVTILGGRE